MKVSVVVISYNTKDLLKQCIGSIPAGLAGNMRLAYEIIVVDNASTDGSVEMVEHKFPMAGLIQNRDNKGYAYAVNKGIESTTGDYILVLNSDIILPSGCVLPMVEYMELNPKTAIVGPQLIHPDGKWQRSYGRTPSIVKAFLDAFFVSFVEDRVKSLARRLGFKLDTKPKSVGYVDGAATLVRRKVFDEIGLFDERFFFYAEDADLCLRSRKAGWNVMFVPQNRIIHVRGASSMAKEQIPFYIQLAKANLQFIKKHYGIEEVWLYRFFMAFNLFARFAKNWAELLFLSAKGDESKRKEQVEKLKLLRKLIAVSMWKENVG